VARPQGSVVILQTGDLVLRAATAQDELIVRAWLTTNGRATSDSTDTSGPDDHQAIVERAGEPIGYVAWGAVDDGDSAAMQLVLAPSAWGRGVGSAVAAALSAKLFQSGTARVLARPDVIDDRAVRSYERAGFAATHESDGALVMERTARPITPWVWRNGGGQIIPRIAQRTAGDEAPWPLAQPADRVALDDVVARVRARGPGAASAFHVENPRYSAVLIALFEGDRGAEVVLTRRSWVLSSHRGEVSFPGGRTDPGEHPHDTAIREAEEEIGLRADDVEIVGELDQIATVVSRSVIVPVVARLRTRPVVRPMTIEVDRILTVPLVEFLAPRTYRSERWGLDWERVVHFFELDDETVWGATGRMLFQLLTLASSVQ
jgi:8-oxo-dGTP pyrophosphatase MutT (NUDIX family)/RimJ/RimL family protein N-acetyltransferase